MRANDGAILGELKIKPGTNDVFATCFCANHWPKCVKTKTLNSSDRRPHQGRPVGFLAAWIRDGQSCDTASSHNRACIPSLASRRAARQIVTAELNFQDFASKERAVRDGEGSEPEDVP